jgi:hypothetical protein
MRESRASGDGQAVGMGGLSGASGEDVGEGTAVAEHAQEACDVE